MSIKKKLTAIIIIVCCVATAAAGGLLWNTYTLQKKAQLVIPALNYLESIAKTSVIISNQRRVAADFMATGTAAARQEFQARSASADISLQEWKNSIQEQKLLGEPGEDEDLSELKELEEQYLEWRKETTTILDQKHGTNRSKHSIHLNLPPDDAILSSINSSLEDGIEEVHTSYHNLLMYMGIIPWLITTSTEQMERTHIAIDYFIAVIRTADNLNKQLKELMNYLQSAEADHLDMIYRSGIQTEDALEKWSEAVKRKNQFEQREVNEAVLLPQSAISSYRQAQSLIDLIEQKMQAGNDKDAMTLVNQRLQVLLDKQLLPAVALAKADSKREINNVSNKLTRTAKSAFWQALVVIIAVTLLIAALVFRLMRMLSTSITQLHAGIENIGDGNLNNRLNPQTTDELGRLAASLDAMTERLQQSHNENAALNAMLEKQLEQLETANREIESFSYMVSHDLRNPITAINCYAELMQEEFSRNPELPPSKHLQQIRKSSRRLTQLTDDIMLLSRVTHTEIYREKLDASSLAGEIMNELIQREPDRKVSFICQPDIVINGSSQLIPILLENILGNAWKYTRTKEKAVIEFGQTCKEGEMVCFVRDNGVGFNTGNAQNIFGPFARSQDTSPQFEGAGIGLAIAQKVMNCHNGKIWAESASGEGAVFYFTFPEA